MIKRILSNKKNTALATSLLLILIVLAGFIASQLRTDQPSSPNHTTILPVDKSIEDLGGWKLSSPPGSTPAFSYSDTLGDVHISVSQQPIPSSFEGDIVNKVTELAKQNNATTEIDINSMTAYIGTSAKGPQSVIFTKNDLLIFIKSQQKISNESWVKYISNLK